MLPSLHPGAPGELTAPCSSLGPPAPHPCLHRSRPASSSPVSGKTFRLRTSDPPSPRESREGCPEEALRASVCWAPEGASPHHEGVIFVKYICKTHLLIFCICLSTVKIWISNCFTLQLTDEHGKDNTAETLRDGSPGLAGRAPARRGGGRRAREAAASPAGPGQWPGGQADTGGGHSPRPSSRLPALQTPEPEREEGEGHSAQARSWCPGAAGGVHGQGGRNRLEQQC